MKCIRSLGIGNSRPRFFLSLTIVMMLVLSFSAAAQNHYYVSTSGSDSNSGTTPSAPWKTISHAVSAFSLGSGGSVIHVADGTYSQNVSVNRGGSSPTARLVIQCDNGVASALAAQGHCMFSGSGVAFNLSGGSNFDIRGFDIGNNPNQMTAIDGQPCGPAGHSTCLDSVHILGNYIHDSAQNAPLDSSGCVILGTAPGAILPINHHGWYVNDLQVVGNIILRHGPLPKAACNTGPNGLYIDTQGAIIENNLIVQVHNIGIQNYGQDCNARISNNTVITAHFGMIITGGGEAQCTSGHNTINNNIILNTISSKFWGNIGCDASHPNLIGHNITDGVGADFDRTPNSCSTVSSLIHASGASLFVNYKTDGTGDYSLKAASPADAAGFTECTSGGAAPCVPTVDISALARSASTPSIGVFEGAASGASLPSAPTGLTAQVQ